MKAKVVTYRIEGNNGLGMFGENYFMWNNNSVQSDEITNSFIKVKGMSIEFERLEGIYEYYCAFKDLHHTLDILPFHLIEYLMESGLKLVEIEGEVIMGETQTIFKPSEVRKKQISVGKLRNKLAREVAREHLKQEFKVLNVHNYLILD